MEDRGSAPVGIGAKPLDQIADRLDAVALDLDAC